MSGAETIGRYVHFGGESIYGDAHLASQNHLLKKTVGFNPRTGLSDIHLEKGDILDNPRLTNQSHLSLVAPGFIPQLAVPDAETEQEMNERFHYGGGAFSVERIHGPQWMHMINSPQIKWEGRVLSLTFRDHICIALKTLEQMQFLFGQYQVLLTDRNETNVLLKLIEDETDLKKWNYCVYQVDFAYVYDAVNDTYHIGNEVDLRSRVTASEQNIKDSQRTKEVLAHQIRVLVGHIANIAKKSFYTETISNDVRNAIDEFEKTWNVMGFSQNNQYLDFETARIFLMRVLNGIYRS